MNLKCSQITGLIFTIISGTMVHYLYKWSGNNCLVGLFSSVNESVWEHLKLIFTPVFLFGIIEYLSYGKSITNFVPIKVLSILIGMIFIIALFYGYTSITKKNYLLADISIFILSVVLSYLFSCHFLNTEFLSSSVAVIIGWIGLIFLLFSFMYFTYNPPHKALFLDPVSGNYGINKRVLN